MLNNQPVKVIIDTNLWIGFLISKELGNLKELLVSQSIEVVLCEQIKEEINRVTQRPKLQKYFSAEKVQELLEFLGIIGVSIDIVSEVSVCRDTKDNFLLALAQDSQADFLITGDVDLLTLGEFAGTKIITYQDFLARI